MPGALLQLALANNGMMWECITTTEVSVLVWSNLKQCPHSDPHAVFTALHALHMLLIKTCHMCMDVLWMAFV